ncbi:MAG: NAD(P)H-hydrate dehydratase [Candidatus Aramenus sp.]|jgi:NAD(P)H-hydrate epimerase|nr:NAD(P)H-hydrate dehydratase [Candidatus Aramenus sp.]
MITSLEMRALEVNSEALGVPTLLLMENAGRSVKDEVAMALGDVKGKTVYAFVGHGGKGGDALVAVRHLVGEGARAVVFLLGENKHRDAAFNLSAIREMDYSIRLVEIKDVEQLAPVEGDVLIDGMLGTGFSGKPREPFRTAINVFNRSKGFKVSIDVPSGIDSDTGEAPGEFVVPDLVVTFHDLKPGLARRGFNIVVKGIGIPPEAYVYVGPGDLLTRVKKRDMKSKKGAGGRVLIIGGSKTYSGAPLLSALASLKTGADLVYVASPVNTANIVASYSPDLIAIKLKGENVNPGNLEELKPWIDKVNVVVIGPGMGLEEETVEASKAIVEYLKERGMKTVVDADALKAIKGTRLTKDFVITPHAGEFKIFFGEEPSQDPRERIAQAEARAKDCNCVVLLKGYFDVITDGERTKLNKTGNPGMTVGGTGDTLTGIVATLMAQGVEPFYAAALGAFVNGLAGSLVYSRVGNHFTPTELVAEIPTVLQNPVEAFKKKAYVRVLD